MDRYQYNPCRVHEDVVDFPSKSRIRRDTKKARALARGLRKQVLRDNKLCLPAHMECDAPEDRTWILDSGSCVDLVRKSDLSIAERKRIREAREPEKLLTANGPAHADKEVLVHIGSCVSSAQALVMDDSPSVLSLGKLIQEKGVLV